MQQEARLLLYNQVLVQARNFEHILEHLFCDLTCFLTVILYAILVDCESEVEHLALDGR